MTSSIWLLGVSSWAFLLCHSCASIPLAGRHPRPRWPLVSPHAPCLASIVAVHLKEEPVAALGLVDPILQQACAGEIAMRSAQRVGPPHLLGDQPRVAQQR